MLKLTYILIVLLSQNAKWNTNTEGAVATGYDVVSYFDGKPQKGLPQYATTHDGATFHFSNQSNLEKFKENPDSFAPEYGGWCAYAMADSGNKVIINPTSYTITHGKLYLFYRRFPTNTLKSWKKDEDNLIKKSRLNWLTKYDYQSQF